MYSAPPACSAVLDRGLVPLRPALLVVVVPGDADGDRSRCFRWYRCCRCFHCRRRYYRRRRPSRAPRRARPLPTTDVSSCPLLPDGRPSDAPSLPPLLRRLAPSRLRHSRQQHPITHRCFIGPRLATRCTGTEVAAHDGTIPRAAQQNGSVAARMTAIALEHRPGTTCCTGSTCSATLPPERGGAHIGRYRRSSQQTRSATSAGPTRPSGSPVSGGAGGRHRRGSASQPRGGARTNPLLGIPVPFRAHDHDGAQPLDHRGPAGRAHLTRAGRGTPRAVRVGPGRPSPLVQSRPEGADGACRSILLSIRSRSPRWAWEVICTTRSASPDPGGGSPRRRRSKTWRSSRVRSWIHSRRSTPWPVSASPSSASPGGPTASSTSLPTWGGETSLSQPCSPPKIDLGVPVLAANDADLGALAEYRRGMRPGIGDLIYVAGEFGIGAGSSWTGGPCAERPGTRARRDTRSINPAGLQCRCGAIGCWETEAGEVALLRHAGLTEGTGRVDEVAERAAVGDGPTLRAIAEVGRWLGFGIGNLINIFNPDLVTRWSLSAPVHVPRTLRDRRCRAPDAPSVRGARDDRPQQPGSRCAAHRSRRAGAVGRHRRTRRHQRPERRRVTPRNAGRRSLVWLVLGVTAGSLAALAVVVLILNVFGSNASAAAADPPHFVEEAAAAGVHHVYDGDFTFFVGGGVAAFDCDDDGRPDLYFAGGSEPGGALSQREPGRRSAAIRRRADPATDLTSVTGAYPLDIDGDGHIDLAVLRYGENVLLRGLGDCRFERANERWASTAVTPGRRRSAPRGRARRRCPRWRSATTWT